jgi:hypothetical protein
MAITAILIYCIEDDPSKPSYSQGEVFLSDTNDTILKANTYKLKKGGAS